MVDSRCDSNAPARSLWLANGLPYACLENLVLSERPDPVVNSSFKLGTVAQTAIGLSGLSAAYFHELRTATTQTVSVNARHAVLEFKSEAWYTINDDYPKGALFDEIAGFYRTRDDSYVLIHTNFPHHKQGILDILHCQATRESVQAALLQWDAQAFEDEAAALKMCSTAFRSFEQWDRHPQAMAIERSPPVQLIKIADAPKRAPNKEASRPLEGIRVLDLTRVLAGPVCGRTLAAHGADVLYITSPNLPSLPFLDKDTSRGKRTTQLDLTQEEDRRTLTDLGKGADVFLQAYRPGGLHEKGFGAYDLAKTRPGIVYANLSAYGWEGPWAQRRGFDSLVQNATGIGYAEAAAFQGYRGEIVSAVAPKPLPCQAIDHAAGQLLAFGINAALCKTITEGGSREVRVSLAAVGRWIRSLGCLDPSVAFGEGPEMPLRVIPPTEEITAFSVNIETAIPSKVKGVCERSKPMKMVAIKHAAKLSMTPAQEGKVPDGLDANDATWSFSN